MNIRNVQNTIPLHVALTRGAKSCVGMLLSAGANCNLQVSISIKTENSRKRIKQIAIKNKNELHINFVSFFNAFNSCAA